MAQKNAVRHDANDSDEFEPSILSRGQLVQMVIDPRRWLGEQRVQADRERELITIHPDTAEREICSNTSQSSVANTEKDSSKSTTMSH